MSELFAEFQKLMAPRVEGAVGTSVDVVLQVLDPAHANLLRLCAIPHHFSPQILRVLAPGLDWEQAEARCRKFAQLSFIVSDADGLVLHDLVRRYLFTRWLKPEAAGEFRAASARLVKFFDQPSPESAASAQESRPRNWMFHLIGADQERGFQEFEALCRRARRQLHLSECATLIRLVHEYDPILPPDLANRLAYHEGKLASDLREWARAEELFQRTLAAEQTPPILRLKALLRLGSSG